MNRIFMFAYQKCLGQVGGGGGVVFRLYQANKKYKLLNDVFYIYRDRVIQNCDDCGTLAQVQIDNSSTPFIKRMLKCIIPNICAGFKRICDVRRDENIFTEIIKQADNKLHFDKDDVYIFHDMQFAHPFLKRYPFKKNVMVMHCQGSYYNEWCAFTGHHFKPLHWYYKKTFKDIVSKLCYIAFPASGAEESFIESDPELSPIIKSTRRIYLYNGIDIPDMKSKASEEWINQLDQYSGYIFVTVAALNEAKAVERIPEYLGALKRAGYDYKWILIGQGVKADKVQEEIVKARIKENTLWIKHFIKHDDILQILSRCDFYILFHRYSVFDLTTLEAMHYGAIPILTPVGGNKDVIENGNGLYVNDFRDASSLISLLKSDKLGVLHEKNREIQRERFNDYSFLNRYAELCYGLMKDN